MSKKEPKWIQDFNRKLNFITKQLEELSEYMPKILAFSIEAASLIRYYDVRSHGIETENLEQVVGCLVELEKIRWSIEKSFPNLAQYTLDREKVIVGMLLILANKKQISFGEVCSTLLKHFPREVLMQIVSIEDILEEFGTDEAIRWNQLLELEAG